MPERRAECSCGQLSAICSGEPARVSVCHCLACKRRTGSAFSYNARYAPEAVRVEGRAAEFVRVGDDGGRVIYSFCPDCGSTVHYRIEGYPAIAIPAGAFAEQDFPPPSWSVYHDSRRPPWLEIRVENLHTLG
jgi:hypothetical protein